MHKSERRNDDDDEYSGNLNEQIHYAPQIVQYYVHKEGI